MSVSLLKEYICKYPWCRTDTFRAQITAASSTFGMEKVNDTTTSLKMSPTLGIRTFSTAGGLCEVLQQYLDHRRCYLSFYWGNPLVVFTLSISSECRVPNAFHFRTIQPYYVSPGRGKQIMVAFAHRLFRGAGFTAQLFFLTS